MGKARALICLLLALLLLWGCSPQQADTTQTTATQLTTAATEQPEEDSRHPAAEDRFNDHHLLDRIGMGNCLDLRGEIALVVIFVDEPGFPWDDAGAKRGMTAAFRCEDVLETAAARYSTQLDLKPMFIYSSVPARLDEVDYATWATAALVGAGLDGDTAAQTICDQTGAREAVFMLCINRPGRAYTINHTTDMGTEHAVLFDDFGGFGHELLHMYGAADFYFPQEMKEIFSGHFSESIMLTNESTVVDALTAYMVGWTSELKGSGLAVVEESAWMTDEFLWEAYQKEMVTGYGTRVYNSCVYEGEMLLGIPNGYGVYTWNDGTRYEGEVVNGQRHGRGVLEWSNGSRYEGDFQDNSRTGSGVFTWASGAYYEGEFLNDKFHGQGTCYEADGTIKSGRWENGEFMG